MLYFVSRQCYWPDGTKVVEIAAGGSDFANADMYVPKYRQLGEGQEYTDPREAANAAIEVLRAWRKDGEKKAKVAYGATGGFTMPFEPCTIKEVQKWAEGAYERCPKCAQCGEPLGKVKYRSADSYHDDEEFCSEYCCEKYFPIENVE